MGLRFDKECLFAHIKITLDKFLSHVIRTTTCVSGQGVQGLNKKQQFKNNIRLPKASVTCILTCLYHVIYLLALSKTTHV